MIGNCKIENLYIYPVKGLPGIEVNECLFNKYGLKLDRDLILTDSNGGVLTRRNTRGMVDFMLKLRDDGYLIYSSRLKQEVHLKMDKEAEKGSVGISIWNRVELGIPGKAEVNEFMSAHFEKKVNCFRLNKNGSHAGFHDSAPFLLLSQASLKVIEERYSVEIDIKRFRPNIVINDSVPFDEGNWVGIRIGNVLFSSVKLCTRCIIVNQDPETGVADLNVLKMIQSFMQDANKIKFGLYLSTGSKGIMKKGEEVEKIYK